MDQNQTPPIGMTLEQHQANQTPPIGMTLEQHQANQKAAAEQAVNNNYYKMALRGGCALAGNVCGILLAVHRKSGFWGGVGWFLVGGMAGAATGYTIGAIMDGKPKA